MSVDLKLEFVTLPVTDVDRAKEFYQGLGWRMDADISFSETSRGVQVTPPHSDCSIQFGTNLTDAKPGSVRRLELTVDDIDEARDELIRDGVQVSDVFHLDGGKPAPGPDPNGASYASFASFKDPDGNEFLLQEIKTRLPGRLWED